MTGLNLEEAIGSYRDALAVWRRERAPDQWAQVMNALGAAYVQRARGEPAENVETAIEIFNAALTVRTRDRGPAVWVETTRNLANAYCLRTRGDREENIDTAIAAFGTALAAVPREANPIEWAMTLVGLGNAYGERAADRAESLERAIAAYETAADAVEPASAPQAWVATRVGLGNAHLERLRGGRTENVEQAIRHFEDGLAVATRAGMPREWATLQHGLGGAYALRRLGERAANLQRAVAAYEAAMEVRTRAAVPLAWAMTQQNLGLVLMDPELPGDRSVHQERALAALEEALEIVSREAMPRRWAELRSNIGAVYAKRLTGDRVANLRAAVAAFTDVLEIQTTGSVAWAQAQRNLGTACGDLAILGGDPASAELVDRALAAFAAALQVLRAESRVLETRDAAKGWGDLAFRLGRWREAADAYEISMDAAGDLYGASVRATGKRSELDESVVVCQRAALAWAHAAEEGGACDDLVRAVVAVEGSRARWLGETLGQDQADLVEAEAVDADAVARYRTAAAVLRELEGEERRPARATSQGTEPDAAVVQANEDVLTARLREAQAELAAAINGVRALGGPSATFLERPGFDTVADALRPGQALAYLLVTARGSLALLAHRPPVGPPAVSAVRTELTTRELAAILVKDGSGGYLPGQAYAPHSLGGVLATVLPELGERIVAPIASRLRELGADGVTLVPCGLLGTLPLHAARYCHDGALLRLIDELDVSYSPSARVLATARSLLAASPAGEGTLAGVGNPTSPSPLEYAEGELRAVAALFRESRPLYGADEAPQYPVPWRMRPSSNSSTASRPGSAPTPSVMLLASPIGSLQAMMRVSLPSIPTMSSATTPFIGYPTDCLLGAFRDLDRAAAAAAALAAAGIPTGDITLLRGDEGADRLDGTGAANGRRGARRLVSISRWRTSSSTWPGTKQAVREGRVVVMVRARAGVTKAAALTALRGHGAHFINYYGRFATEEITAGRARTGPRQLAQALIGAQYPPRSAAAAATRSTAIVWAARRGRDPVALRSGPDAAAAAVVIVRSSRVATSASSQARPSRFWTHS